ncbi:hypothetical protein J2Z31_000727 [Sinorhizobium kostiense]|uniref:MFS transporter permease n=1 Tax=Sinorhizobium kostiense TaxID=76747 RepID=A0ABS4QUB5_9HYPH|nr:DUF6064 family protein [Sinorhizobium kostiense]MBP2234237.1 hypothetical protein [Sinorhizobium kostiense]
MSDWITYRLVDFLMFSPRVYYRLVERYNHDVWPLQIIFIAGGLFVLMLAVRRKNRAIAFPALAIAWAFCAWQFLWMRYAVINWPVSYAAAAFLLQAGLIVVSIRPAGAPPPAVRLYGGIGLMLLGLIAYPLLAPFAGRSIASAESFGLMPDPTATTTLGAVLALSPKPPWLLLPIPLLWCAVSGLTLWALQDPGAWVPFASIVATLALVLLSRR